MTLLQVLGASAIAFLANIFTSFLKIWIYPKFGKVGVQAVCFIFAAIGAFYVYYGAAIPNLEKYLLTSATIFAMAITFYEVILQHIDFFKVKTVEIENERAN